MPDLNRSTDRARRVLALANQEAQRFNHQYIGTEHILLGLVKEGSGVAASALKSLGVDLRTVRLEVEKLVKSGPEMVTMGKLPHTPRCKRALDFAHEEADGLNHNYIGTEHLLLGLLREQDGVAAQVLMNLGLKLEDVREEVRNLLGLGKPKEEIKSEGYPPSWRHAQVHYNPETHEIHVDTSDEALRERIFAGLRVGHLASPTWDAYFMAEACYVAGRSPDPATKHGAVIVNHRRRPVGQGYNGFPSGAKKDVYPTTRPEKYPFIIHAETNAILNCTFPPENCTLYVTGPPCSGCMTRIIQAGIKRVVYGQISSNMVDAEDWSRTLFLAQNHDIELVEYNGENPARILRQIAAYLDEKGWK